MAQQGDPLVRRDRRRGQAGVHHTRHVDQVETARPDAGQQFRRTPYLACVAEEPWAFAPPPVAGARHPAPNATALSFTSTSHERTAPSPPPLHGVGSRHDDIPLPRIDEVSLRQVIGGIAPVLERAQSREHLIAEAGAVPVTRASGKSRTVAFRFVTNRRARVALTAFADDSRHGSTRAAKIYNNAHARKKRHPHALRVLARAWLRAMWACCQQQDQHARRRASGGMEVDSGNSHRAPSAARLPCRARSLFLCCPVGGGDCLPRGRTTSATSRPHGSGRGGPDHAFPVHQAQA